MSVSYHRGGREVRWRDADGRRRARRFATEDAADAFDEALAEVSPTARRSDTSRHARSGGVYSYRTAEGVRWRLPASRRHPDDQARVRQRPRRPRRPAPADRAGRAWRGAPRQGDVRCVLERWLAQRRPYLEAGTWTGYEIAVRKRLLPAFGMRSLGALSVEDVREFLAELAGTPTCWVSPRTDSGTLPNLKFSFAAARNRVLSGGWAREVTTRELAAAKDLAGVNMRLKPGGIRELHWHKEAEWSYMIAGRARITAVDENGRTFIDDVAEGDLWNFPAGIPHSIQGLEEGCEFLLVFDDGTSPRITRSCLPTCLLTCPARSWRTTSACRRPPLRTSQPTSSTPAMSSPERFRDRSPWMRSTRRRGSFPDLQPPHAGAGAHPLYGWAGTYHRFN